MASSNSDTSMTDHTRSSKKPPRALPSTNMTTNEDLPISLDQPPSDNSASSAQGAHDDETQSIGPAPSFLFAPPTALPIPEREVVAVAMAQDETQNEVTKTKGSKGGPMPGVQFISPAALLPPVPDRLMALEAMRGSDRKLEGNKEHLGDIQVAPPILPPVPSRRAILEAEKTMECGKSKPDDDKMKNFSAGCLDSSGKSALGVERELPDPGRANSPNNHFPSNQSVARDSSLESIHEPPQNDYCRSIPRNDSPVVNNSELISTNRVMSARCEVNFASSQSEATRRSLPISVDAEPRAREGRDGAGGDTAGRGGRSWRSARASGLRASVARTMDFFVAATLVEDEGEVVVAEQVRFFDRKVKVLGCAALVLVVILSVTMVVTLTAAREHEQRERDQLNAPAFPSTQPSSSPSSSPSYDPRPTLNIVQDRGYVKCGLWVKDLVSKEGLNYQLCRAIAAVLLGNPDNFEGIVVTEENRFQQLHARNVDLLLWGDSHTIEREVREKTTEAGFAFSTPYNYDGLAYFGESKYVKCAENELRYGDCSRLRICAWGGDPLDNVVSAFPLDFIEEIHTLDSFWNGTCNVMTDLRSYLFSYSSREENIERKYVVGDKIMTKEPLAVVTRNDDHEFSNIVNWVINSLFYGEEQGLEMDSSLCQNYTNLTAGVADLNFLNAVYCVGNYGEIYGNDNRGMNHMNNGTGMIYAIPFGNLDRQSDDPFPGDMVLRDIKDAKSLNCGVVVPVGFAENITKNLAGLGTDYCRTLAAALFNGNHESVKIYAFPENDDSSFSALQNGTIDVLAGGSRQWKYYFASSMSHLGFHFSTPYYYGNESSVDDFNLYSLVTREDDVVFSSFVECIVLATIYAQENKINRVDSKKMPLISLFGSDFNWALRDAVHYSGSYGEMYKKNFGDAEKEDRGRNVLNSESGPQIHSFPGIDVVVKKGNTLDGGESTEGGRR